MDNLRVASTVVINSPKSNVWRAITEPAELIQWYAPGCRWEIPELRAGAVLRFFNTETDILSATIEVVRPQKFLSMRWQPDNRFPSATLQNTYELDDEGDSTRVTIAQTGYETAPADVRQQWFQQDEQAFTAIAAALKNHVEQR